MTSSSCPLCERVSRGDSIAEAETALAFFDAFPVSQGHTLIVPRRHDSDYFSLTAEEQRDLWSLVGPVREVLDREFHPAGYNVGLNIGEAAGQTIRHVHLHVIPRYSGDVDDPRGGIRWILPERAAWWEVTDDGPAD